MMDKEIKFWRIKMHRKDYKPTLQIPGVDSCSSNYDFKTRREMRTAKIILSSIYGGFYQMDCLRVRLFQDKKTNTEYFSEEKVS